MKRPGKPLTDNVFGNATGVARGIGERPSANPPPKLDLSRNVNWNPFSTKGRHDEVSFPVTILALGIVLFVMAYLIRAPLDRARVSLDFKQVQIMYSVWFVMSLFGFWMVTTAFIKRWKAILQLEKFPAFLKPFFRLFLLSPLLSIWFTLYTLSFFRGGPQEEGDPVFKRLITGLVSIVVFHASFICWRAVQGDVRVTKSGDIQLVGVPSPRASLKDVLPADPERWWLPEDKFQIHLYPYINPLGKMMISLYGDFVRANALAQEVSKPGTSLCAQRLGFLGVPVTDCYFYQYKKLAERAPFSSAIFGFLFEAKYRQGTPKLTTGSNLSQFKNAQAETSQAIGTLGDEARAATEAPNPLTGFAPAMLTFNNIVSFLEAGPMLKDRKSFSHPRGLLSFFASPELVALEYGQDAQRYMLITRVLPMLKPQLAQLEMAQKVMAPRLNDASAEEVAIEVTDLKSRVQKLEQDPLGLKSEPATARKF